MTIRTVTLPAIGRRATTRRDLTGQNFGRWFVVSFSHTTPGGGNYFICACYCGTIKPTKAKSLLEGRSRSCGCLHYEEWGNRWRKHGQRNSRLFNIWASMKARCNNPKSHKYSSYGARQITVCEQWQDDFTAFHTWAIANGYSDDLQI